MPVFAISLTITIISPDVEGFFANLISSLVITGIIVGLIAYIYDYRNKRAITLAYVTQPHWKPDADVMAMTYGYDHRSRIYKVCVSPVVYLPSKRSLMDAWLAEQNVVEREFTNGKAVMQAARNLHRKLTNAGWEMKVVAWVEFHKRLPCWEYDSGKDIKEISIPSVDDLKKFNPNDLVTASGRRWSFTFTENDNPPPLRGDLQAKINEENRRREQRRKEEEQRNKEEQQRRKEEEQRKKEEQQRKKEEEQQRKREEQELKDAMRPLPAWARGENGQAERKGNDFDIIDLNIAAATTLRTLPGIGRVRAQAIVSHRRTNGDFSSVEDLLDVDGIGPDVLEKIREMVAV